MERRPFLPSLFGQGAFGGSDRSGQGADPFTSLQREVNRMFDDVFRSTGLPAGLGQTSGVLSPSIDVRERENMVELHAELPGVKPDDVDITLDDDLLTVRGEKKFERSDDKENVHVMERSYGSFARSLRLPFVPDPDQVKADYTDGILTVRIPKPAERQQRQRRIQVGRSEGAQKGAQGASQIGSQGAGQPGGQQREAAMDTTHATREREKGGTHKGEKA